jgi:hypothetical protein
VIRSTALLLALAAPVHAEGLIGQDLCQAVWAEAGKRLSKEMAPTAATSAFEDGWCVFEDVILPFPSVFDEVKHAERLRVRGDALTWFLDTSVLPKRLDVEVQGLTTAFAKIDTSFEYMTAARARLESVDAAITISWEAAARELVIERMEIDFPGDNRVSLVARARGVDLSSPGSMQMSLTGFAVTEADLIVESKGLFETYLLNPLGSLVLPIGSEIEGDVEALVEDLRAKAKAGVERFPVASFSQASKAALVSLISELPNPSGTLTLALRSEAGLGPSRLMVFALTGLPLNVAEAAPLFDGVVFDLDWQHEDMQ